MFPEARLDVHLLVRLGRVDEVRIASSRLVQASSLFAGKRPDEVARLLPAIFALCGTAQALAGLGAMEQAAGLPPSAAQVPARQLLALAETVSEHGLGLARDWPMLAGAQPDMAAAKRIRAAMASVRPALYPGGDWTRPGGGTVTPDVPTLYAAIAEARAALVMLVGEDGLNALDTPDGFAAWLAQSPLPVASLLREIAGPDLADLGRGPFLPMPEDGPADLDARLAGDRDGAYLARPDSAGRVFETGPLARQSWHPLIAAQMGVAGPGLLPRFSAKLIEVASSLHEMTTLVHSLNAAVAPAACLVEGAGLGLVEAARGLLAHRVELEGGRVTRYQILAPTEWNFHPAGPLARGLKGAAAGPDLERRAALLVHGLDPCVACAVTVTHA